MSKPNMKLLKKLKGNPQLDFIRTAIEAVFEWKAKRNEESRREFYRTETGQLKTRRVT